MPKSDRVKVGIIGSRFEADIHAAAFQIMPDEVEVVAVPVTSAAETWSPRQEYMDRITPSKTSRALALQTIYSSDDKLNVALPTAL